MIKVGTGIATIISRRDTHGESLLSIFIGVLLGIWAGGNMGDGNATVYVGFATVQDKI